MKTALTTWPCGQLNWSSMDRYMRLSVMGSVHVSVVYEGKREIKSRKKPALKHLCFGRLLLPVIATNYNNYCHRLFNLIRVCVCLLNFRVIRFGGDVLASAITYINTNQETTFLLFWQLREHVQWSFHKAYHRLHWKGATVCLLIEFALCRVVW